MKTTEILARYCDAKAAAQRDSGLAYQLHDLARYLRRGLLDAEAGKFLWQKFRERHPMIYRFNRVSQ